MDKVLADTLKANLRTAKTAEEFNHAFALALIAVVDCQFRTGERIKELLNERAAGDGDGTWKRISLALLKYGGWVLLIIAALLKVRLPLAV